MSSTFRSHVYHRPQPSTSPTMFRGRGGYNSGPVMMATAAAASSSPAPSRLTPSPTVTNTSTSSAVAHAPPLSSTVVHQEPDKLKRREIEFVDHVVSVIQKIGEFGPSFLYTARDDVRKNRRYLIKATAAGTMEQARRAEAEVRLFRKFRDDSTMLHILDCGFSTLDEPNRNKRNNGNNNERPEPDRLPNRRLYCMLFESCPDSSLTEFIAKHRRLHEKSSRTRLFRKQRRETGFLPISLVLRLFSQMAQSIATLHTYSDQHNNNSNGHQPPNNNHNKYLGILHLDLKPGRFLVRDMGGDYRVKLCSFGCAIRGQLPLRTQEDRQIASFLIEDSTTLVYRAPEMVNFHMAEEINGRADVWSLGCCLYAMLFMRDCFTPQSKLDIIGGKYRVPTSHPYSPSVLDFLGRMLTVDPATRCHIGEVLRCIDALKRDMPLPPRRRRSVETILTTEDSTTGEIKQTTFRVLEQHTSLPDDDMHHAQAYYQGGNNSAHQHPAFSSAVSDSAAMMLPIEDEEIQDDDMQQFNSSFTDKSDSDGTEWLEFQPNSGDGSNLLRRMVPTSTTPTNGAKPMTEEQRRAKEKEKFAAWTMGTMGLINRLSTRSLNPIDSDSDDDRNRADTLRKPSLRNVHNGGANPNDTHQPSLSPAFEPPQQQYHPPDAAAAYRGPSPANRSGVRTPAGMVRRIQPDGRSSGMRTPNSGMRTPNGNLMMTGSRTPVDPRNRTPSDMRRSPNTPSTAPITDPSPVMSMVDATPMRPPDRSSPWRATQNATPSRPPERISQWMAARSDMGRRIPTPQQQPPGTPAANGERHSPWGASRSDMGRKMPALPQQQQQHLTASSPPMRNLNTTTQSTVDKTTWEQTEMQLPTLAPPENATKAWGEEPEAVGPPTQQQQQPVSQPPVQQPQPQEPQPPPITKPTARQPETSEPWVPPKRERKISPQRGAEVESKMEQSKGNTSMPEIQLHNSVNSLEMGGQARLHSSLNIESHGVVEAVSTSTSSRRDSSRLRQKRKPKVRRRTKRSGPAAAENETAASTVEEMTRQLNALVTPRQGRDKKAAQDGASRPSERRSSQDKMNALVQKPEQAPEPVALTRGTSDSKNFEGSSSNNWAETSPGSKKSGRSSRRTSIQADSVEVDKAAAAAAATSRNARRSSFQTDMVELVQDEKVAAASRNARRSSFQTEGVQEDKNPSTRSSRRSSAKLEAVEAMQDDKVERRMSRRESFQAEVLAAIQDENRGTEETKEGSDRTGERSLKDFKSFDLKHAKQWVIQNSPRQSPSPAKRRGSGTLDSFLSRKADAAIGPELEPILSVAFSESKEPSEAKEGPDAVKFALTGGQRTGGLAMAADKSTGSATGTSGERLLGDRSLESDDPNDPMKVLAPMMPSLSKVQSRVTSSTMAGLRRPLEVPPSPGDRRRRTAEPTRRGSTENVPRRDRRSSSKGKQRSESLGYGGMTANTSPKSDSVRHRSSKLRSSSVPLNQLDDKSKLDVARRPRSQGAAPKKFSTVSEEEEPSMPMLPPRRRESSVSASDESAAKKKIKKSKKSKSREKLERKERSKVRSKRRGDDDAKRLVKSFNDLTAKTAGLSLAGLSKSIHAVGDAVPVTEDSRR